MLNVKRTLALAFSIAAFGLTSCSPDKTHVDTFAAPTPEIIRNGKASDVATFNVGNSKSVDLMDTLSFKNAKLSKVTIQSICKFKEQTLTSSFTFGGDSPLKFFQIVPESILAKRIIKNPIVCAFELGLYNSVGSNHIFTLQQVIITQTQDTEIGLQMSTGEFLANTPNPDPIPVQKLSEIRLRSPYFASESIRPICETLKSSALAAGSVADLAAFNWSPDKSLHSDQELMTLESQPIQLCRLLVYQGAERKAISPIFSVRLKRKALSISIRYERPAFCDLNEHSCNEHFAILKGGHPFLLTRWVVANPSRVPRYFRVTRELHVVKIDTIFKNTKEAATFSARSFYKTSVIPRFPEKTTRKKIKGEWLISLRPGRSVTLELVFKASYHHNGPRGFVGVRLTPRRLGIVEVDAAGVVLAKQGLARDNESYAYYSSSLGQFRLFQETAVRASWN